MKLNDQITVIIPTHERHYYLKRSLNYWSHIGLKILVADSSENKYREKIPKNINYFHYSDKLFIAKIVDILSKVQTKYTVFCADDDFITKTGLLESIKFLDKNVDYVVAHGRYISIVPPGNKIEQNGDFCWGPKYESKSNSFDKSEDRLNYHFENYVCPTFYGVHKTNIIQIIWEETKKTVNDPMDLSSFIELLPSMLTVILGKVKRLDNLYCAREKALKKSYPSGILNDKKEDDFNDKYEQFRNCLSKHLSREAGMNIIKAGKVVDECMEKYLSKIVKKKSLLSKFKKELFQFSEKFKFVGFLRDIYRNSYFHQNRSTSYYTDWPYPKDIEAFNLIRSYVLNHNKSL